MKLAHSSTAQADFTPKYDVAAVQSTFKSHRNLHKYTKIVGGIYYITVTSRNMLVVLKWTVGWSRGSILLIHRVIYWVMGLLNGLWAYHKTLKCTLKLGDIKQMCSDNMFSWHMWATNYGNFVQTVRIMDILGLKCQNVADWAEFCWMAT